VSRAPARAAGSSVPPPLQFFRSGRHIVGSHGRRMAEVIQPTGPATFRDGERDGARLRSWRTVRPTALADRLSCPAESRGPGVARASPGPHGSIRTAARPVGTFGIPPSSYLPTFSF